ncbi:hypothetical protein OB13_09840 [Pontibacter sp. HJ8]
MYHRVAELESDVWRLAVSPLHFEQQLQVLSKNWHVVPLVKLAEDLKNNKLKRNSVAITFDDGYADNFLAARPLLEHFQLPATFFICSGNIDKQAAFWWDEVEQIFLLTENLPKIMDMQLADASLVFDLKQEGQLTEALRQQHRCWKAYVTEPPTLRSALFLQVWEILKPLPHQQQQQHLQQLKSWAGIPATPQRLHHSMRLEQLQELGKSQLFTIGAHTVSHPDLAALDTAAQQHEILENKTFLEQTIGRGVDLLAYPYGRYNSDTVALAAQANFTAAVTTNGSSVQATSARYTLGRFLADNWSGNELDRYMTAWLKS